MDIDVRHIPERHRYVLTADGANAGHAGYTDDGNVRSIMHTWIEDEYEGQGLGSQLIVAALDDIKSSGKQVIPACPFVPKVLKDNPEYIALVPESSRDRYGLND